MKMVKEGEYVEVLSINASVWNIETCQSHYKNESWGRGRIMEGMNQTMNNICIHGNDTMKPLLQLSYSHKNIFLKKLQTSDKAFSIFFIPIPQLVLFYPIIIFCVHI
jgi:hypothetical protein